MTRVPFRPPLAAGPLLRFLRGRAIPMVEAVGETGYRRTLRVGREAAHVALDFSGPAHVRVALDGAGSATIPAVLEQVRACAGLDVDPGPIDAALRADPVLAPLVARHAGLRVPGSWDGFECAIRAVLGQQVTVAAARTLLGRLVEAAGPVIPKSADGLSRLFPTPAEVRPAELSRLGVPGSRLATIKALATAVDAGDVVLDGSVDTDTAGISLAALPGIGPWTVAYVRMRALRDPDAFPATDLGVRVACERLGLPESGTALLARAERWRPWRAYAVMHLWQSLSEPANEIGEPPSRPLRRGRNKEGDR